jgi:HK97 family phage major capsid protein
VPNPYLTRLRSQYKDLQSGIEDIQTRAVDQKREPTEDELKAITGQVEQARSVFSQIETLTEQEERNKAVGEMAAKLDAGAEQQLRSGQAGNGQAGERLTGTTQTRDRDPGHYRSVKEGGAFSFFSDEYRARAMGDHEAQERLVGYARHAGQAEEQVRATLTTSANGPGLIVPHWMVEEFETLNYQMRAVANQVRNVPLNGDSRPMTLPKQTAGTSAAVGVQSAEGDAPADSNDYDTDTDIVTPKPYIGEQVVSRQFLEQGNPALDALIYGDLSNVTDAKIEAAVCAALIAGAASNVATIASDLPDDPAAGDSFGENGGKLASDAVIDATTLIYSTRFASPDFIFVTPQRFGKFRKLRDANDRPIMPVSAYNPQNAAGVVTGLLSGEFEGLTMLPSTGFGDGATFPEKFLVARAKDTILFEDAEMRYRYEEKGGPSKITLGLWKYVAIKVRQGGKSVRTITVTASAHA